MENKLDSKKIINSLKYQIANQALIIAEREALIEELGRENKELKDKGE